MGNTSTKTADEVRKEIARVLQELASYSLIQSIVNPKRYLYILYYVFKVFLSSLICIIILELSYIINIDKC